MFYNRFLCQKIRFSVYNGNKAVITFIITVNHSFRVLILLMISNAAPISVTLAMSSALIISSDSAPRAHSTRSKACFNSFVMLYSYK